MAANERAATTDHARKLSGMTLNRNKPLKAKRTPKSCDRCKDRKTKCVDPIPGPCRYCASVSAKCEIARERKQRPYYHVSEDEYQCCMRILRHVFPQHDLNLPTMKSIVGEIENGTLIPETRAESSPSKTSVQEEEINEPAHDSNDGSTTDEISALHGQLGCLMVDSAGKYRHVGAASDIRFNAAVRSILEEHGFDEREPNVIPPLKTTALPPTPAASSIFSSDSGRPDIVHLPPRSHCSRYVAKFFTEVHCLHWFYSSERFHTLLERTYLDNGVTANASWLCSLYSIFALGSATPYDGEDLADSSPAGGWEGQESLGLVSSSQYLAMAKALVPRVCDEADLESIRALALLSLALQPACYSVASYLYVGLAARIAYSVGLHYDRAHTSQSLVEREDARRTWWTLYLLDQEFALQSGNPGAISDERTTIRSPLPNEQILNPGTSTPVGYLAVSRSLCQLTRDIAQAIYVETPDSPTVSLSKVADLISSLGQWLNNVPSHIRWGASAAPSHRRPIGILHLRYWAAMMLATRPFLLYTVIRGARLTSPEKKQWFEDLSASCINASDNSLSILNMMGNNRTLSSLTTFDVNCILEVVMISLLALAKHNLPKYRANIKIAMDVLRSMEQIGWCKKATTELIRQVNVLGLYDVEQQEDIMRTEYDNVLTSTEQDFNFNIASNVNGLDALDVYFGELFPAEMEMADSTPMNMFQQITDFSRSITTSMS